jgi:hypothetical protein
MNVKLCYPEGDPANAAQICLAVCAVSNGGPFSITTPSTSKDVPATAVTEVVPATADSGNVGFCLDYRKK